jgi:hypothetical protein
MTAAAVVVVGLGEVEGVDFSQAARTMAERAATEMRRFMVRLL